jgi:hypothetical protein
MSLVPRSLLKNYSQDNLKPLELSEKSSFASTDFSSPQSASLNVSVTSNPLKIVGRVGKIPNLFGFANVDVDTLRTMDKFRALPHESQMDFRHEDSHRLCRQGTNAWVTLHKGVLTSGNILGALGFKEAHVVSKIGLHGECASHEDLIRAVMVMREDASSSSSQCTGEEEGEDDARESNDAIVRAYNEGLVRKKEEVNLDASYDDNNDHDEDDDEEEVNLSASDDEEEEEEEGDDDEEKFFPPIKSNEGLFHFDFSSATPLDILRASVDTHHSIKKSPSKRKTNNAKKGSKKQKQKKTKQQQKAKQLKKKKQQRALREARELMEDQPFGGTLGLTRLGFCRLKAREGEQSVRLAWGNTAEAGALAQLLNDFPNVEEIHEVGLCRVSKDVLLKYEEICGCKLPPLGASPDAIALIRSNDDDNVVERVVVEVKNRSPFYRTQNGYYRVGDPPLPKSIPAYHVPQVQLEMVSANASSCLLCMRNVTRGTSVFRVKRDEEYLKQMFRVIGRLYENYCLKSDSKTPPENWLANDPIHAALVCKTRDIAQNAELVTVLEPGVDENGEAFDPFLDEYATLAQ